MFKKNVTQKILTFNYQHELCCFSFEKKDYFIKNVKLQYVDVFCKINNRIFFLKNITTYLITRENSVNTLEYTFYLYVKAKYFLYQYLICINIYFYFCKIIFCIPTLFFTHGKKKFTKFLIFLNTIKIRKKDILDEEVKKNMIYKKFQEKQSVFYTRPPIVSILGHVNHGKTTLLDYIRKSFIVKSEFDGITQHLNSYFVDCAQGKVTFLDTPGHAAFDSLRKLSLKFTDIVLLLVAVDDGVMPQTIEILQGIQNLNLSVIVVLNKVDKNIDESAENNIIQNMLKFGIVPENLGGNNIFIKISAKTGFGVDNLLSMICLQGEMLELKSKLNCNAKGGIIETKMNKGVGIIVSVIVLEGILHSGFFVSGSTFGKIRFILDMAGKKIKKAYPSVPCNIVGLNVMPVVGDFFEVVEDEKTAKKLIEKKYEERNTTTFKKIQQIEDLFLQETVKNKIYVLLKVDTFGSIEPIVKSLTDVFFNTELILKITKNSIGDISESDVDFALLTKSIILAFNVKIDAVAKRKVYKENVPLYFFKSVYNIVNFFENKIHKATEDKDKKDSFVGTVVVRSIFKTTKTKNIAGCYVEKGLVKKNYKVSILRKNIIICNDTIESLNYFKKSVLEVPAKRECGIILKSFNDFEIGDIISVLKEENN